MAVTQNSYTQSGNTTKYAFTFPYLKASEVKVQIDATVTTAFTLFNATTVQLNTAPASGAKIKIYRETDTDTLAATFYAGSAIKSEDLNDNFTQNLHTTQEVNARYLSNLGGTMVGDMTMAEDVDIIFEGATDNEHQTRLTVEDPDADRTITLPNVTGTVVTTGDTESVTSAMITDGTIVNADINASAAIAQSKLNIANATTSAAGYQSAADKTKLDGIDTGAKDDQTAAEIRVLVEAATDSNVFTDADHTKLNAIEDNATADQTAAEIRTLVESASDSNVFTDADHSKLNAIEASATADQTADEIKSLIASSPLDASHLAANSVTTSEIADAELTTLAGMPGGTASTLADSTPLEATTAEINAICDGKTVQTTISDTDAAYPTSGAVVDYVAAQIAPLGGLEVIANEVSFPNTAVDEGVVISISDAGGVVVDSNGNSTTARTLNGTTVTFEGFPSSLQSTTLAASIGLLVSKKAGSNQTYLYHKILGKEDDIKQLSDDINDFAARYRVASSAPSSSLDNGDLWYDTSNAKMMVYNSTSSAWEEVSSTGDFYINTISSYSGTGGNSATFNGSAYRFTLSNPPQAAQQLIVSVNGVLQKPNSGTGQPSEGFAINGSTIVFSAAPATSSPYFIITVGSTVAIGTPSDNTVATAKIQNLAVTTAKIAADAVDGTKIADDAVGAEHIEVLDDSLQLADSVKIKVGTGNDLEIYHVADGNSFINDTATAGQFIIQAVNGHDIKHSNGELAIRTLVDGTTSLYYDGSPKFETTSTGAVVHCTSSNDNSGLTVRGSESVAAILNFESDDGDDNNDKCRFYRHQNGGSLILQDYESGSYANMAKYIGGGAVELYHDGNKKFQTDTDGCIVTGNLYQVDGDKIMLGNTSDLQLYHDGANSYIMETGTGDLFITGKNNIRFLDYGTNEDMAKMVSEGAVELYYDNALKANTYANGFYMQDIAKVQGVAGGNATVLLYADNALHNADHWKIASEHVGNGFTIQNYASGGWQTVFKGTDSRTAELHCQGSKKLNTYSEGVTVTGRVNGFTNESDALYGTDYVFHKFQTDLNNWGLGVENSNDTSPYGMFVKFSDASPDNNTLEAIAFADNTTGRYKVYSDGDVWNHDNSYTGSDATLKENIVDATPKLEDLKKIKVRNFNWKSEYFPEKSKKKHLGFIAQEVEEVFPALVTEHDISPEAGDKDHTPIMKKAIKQAWDPIIIKAMQELIEKVETLETKVAALEAK